MQQPEVHHIPMFHVAQKLAPIVNRYRVLAPDANGGEGALLAFAQQKRMAFKEKVSFFADEAMTTPVFGFGARQVVDLSAGYDVTDQAGAPLAFFKKDFKASLLRSTFLIEGPGYAGKGAERNEGIAILRRFINLPFRFDFDFTDGATGQRLFSVERKASLRDRYTVTVPDQRVDWRVAASVAVALDALMSR